MATMLKTCDAVNFMSTKQGVMSNIGLTVTTLTYMNIIMNFIRKYLYATEINIKNNTFRSCFL